MTQQNNEFENWWKKEINTIEFDLWKNQYPDNTWQYADHSTNLAWITWQAATTESDKEIAELKADNETLISVNNELSNEVVKLNEMYEGRIDHLEAHINDLREALEKTNRSTI